MSDIESDLLDIAFHPCYSFEPYSADPIKETPNAYAIANECSDSEDESVGSSQSDFSMLNDDDNRTEGIAWYAYINLCISK